MRKRFISFMLLISMISIFIATFPVSTSATTTSWDGHVANGFESGEGTEADPYIIKTGSQLAYLAETVNSGIAYEGEYFELANDIILNSSDVFVYDERGYVTGVKNEKALNEWTAIGNYISSKSYNAFSGVFDGNNFEIKGLYINKPTISCQGVFGYCKNAIIKNVGVTEGYIIGNDCVGGMVGQSDNSLAIENCHNSCAVRGEDSWASIGGLIGYYVHTDCKANTLYVKNCYNSGNISGAESDDQRVGGLIGYVIEEYNAGMIEITNCYNEGVVSTGLSNYNCGGGVIGETAALYGAIKSIGCYNLGEINTGNSAGVIGRVYTNTSASQIVENCYNLGIVIGNTYAGGIVGTNDPGGTSTIKNCYNIGMVQGNTSQVVGGIVGWNVAWNGLATITNCYNIGTISGTGGNVGGIAGQNTAAQGLSYTGTATIENCYNSGVISGDYDAFGGIVGINNPYSGTGKVKVTNCYNTGIVGNGLYATIGGIAGVASL